MSDIGFIVYEVPGEISAIPSMGHFVPINEDTCAALGSHDSTDGGKHLVVTEFLSYKPNGIDIHEDIYFNFD